MRWPSSPSACVLQQNSVEYSIVCFPQAISASEAKQLAISYTAEFSVLGVLSCLSPISAHAL